MNNNKLTLSKVMHIISLTLISYSFFSIATEEKLSTLHFHAASVMPAVWQHRPNKPPELHVLLSREAGGKDKGTYDDWGGGRDRNDSHPIVAAAREFSEEAITHKTLGITAPAVRNYIDVNRGKTFFVVVQKGVGGKSTMVTYITLFDTGQINRLMQTFYKKREEERSWKYREKDSLALIPWTHLAETISNAPYARNVTVTADLIDPTTNALKKEVVTLRPAFVSKLHSFFKGKPHTYGENEKVLFFKARNQDTKTCSSTTQNIEDKKTSPPSPRKQVLEDQTQHSDDF